MNIIENKFKLILISISLIILMLISAFSVFMYSNKGAPISWNVWGPINEQSGIANQGFDVVAYHIDGQAITGKPIYSYKWKQVEWVFSSEKNKNLFQKNPDKFAPEFGGYCATAVSAGITFNINPNVWHIEDDKLYLFYDDAARQDWAGKIKTGIINTGNTNWKKYNN